MTRALAPVLHEDAPVWPVAAAALPIGFVVAQASGVRPVGGAVMVALLAACAWRARGRPGVGAGAQLAVAAVALGSFVASHVLAASLTVPGAVGAAGAAVGAAAYALLDRRSA